MAEISVQFLQCDFCLTKYASDAKIVTEFQRVAEFDICPTCFSAASDALSEGICHAWNSLQCKGEGAHNGRVVALIKSLCSIALHECVGEAVTE